MILRCDGAYLNVDVDATRRFHQKMRRKHPYACDCLNCQNYRVAIRRIDKAALLFLASLGIDPACPIDIDCYGTPSERILPYHAHTLLVSSEITPPKDESVLYFWGQHGLEVWVRDELSLPPSVLKKEGFLPDRWIAFTFCVRLPWVMGNVNDNA